MVLWECVRDFVPWRLRTDKDVLTWPCTRITVYSSDHHLADHAGVRACQRGSTSLTEAPCMPWGRFIALDEVGARRPVEGSPIQNPPRRISGTVPLPAHGTVAIAQELKRRSDFVCDSSTEATSLDRHTPISNRVCQANLDMGRPTCARTWPVSPELVDGNGQIFPSSTNRTIKPAPLFLRSNRSSFPTGSGSVFVIFTIAYAPGGYYASRAERAAIGMVDVQITSDQGPYSSRRARRNCNVSDE